MIQYAFNQRQIFLTRIRQKCFDNNLSTTHMQNMSGEIIPVLGRTTHNYVYARSWFWVIKYKKYFVCFWRDRPPPCGPWPPHLRGF